MKKTTTRRARPANSSVRGIGTLPWSYFVVIAICGCVIAAGFLLAARQHFMSMDLGMKNSKLRKQLDELESENRRLTLAREIALSPMEITKTAKNLGFVEVFAAEPTLAAVQTPAARNAAKPADARIAPRQHPEPAVVKTISQRPVQAAERAEKPRPARRAETAKQSIRPDLTAVAKLR